MRILVISILMIAGCSQGPDIGAIKSRFEANPEEYKLLGKMVKEDFQGEHCFTIGLDHMGDYWEYNQKWSHSKNYKEKMSLDRVLEELSISDQRYKKYKRLFSETGTERATFCSIDNVDSYHLLAYRSGLAVSGCSLTINMKTPIPRSIGKRGEGDFTEVIALTDGWYIKYDCT